ncbi:20550_t:CDS:2 [Funneliformis geosporum]|uniref:5259_t:CDS:1 n=1 Tax=Funneliformis geosporum TaxID=1117311 RepID=A0A9W4WQ39_9GLOM|nr:20550_t:CDS:2 [Funneliformis geosporum]CAI2163536.1 5259_t:CDS:2 [Funneliformis geosporum]
MTTATAPATSSEHRDPFQTTKNRIATIATLSSKNQEILDQMNKLQHSQSQTLNLLNSQLETIPHINGSGQHIDNLVNNLKSRQRRSNNLQQQQSISSVLRMSSDKLSNGDDAMEMEDDNELNESRTITANDSLSSRKSAKLAIVNRNVKELKKMDSPSNNGGELDWKYFSTENNSDSDGNSSVLEGKDFENVNDNNLRRRSFKGHPTLTVNTKTTKSLITPESSDSEFDFLNSHMPLAPTLGGGRNPLRAARHSSAEHYNGNITDRRSRPANSLFSSVEEERSSLSDVAEQNEVNDNTSENINRGQTKHVTVNGRKRAQKYLDDYSFGNDAPKTFKLNRRSQTDDSYADIPDDNSSVMSSDSMIVLEELRTRIQKLESERGIVDDDNISERRVQRKKKHNSDLVMSPAAFSPDSSQGGTSSITCAQKRSSASAQHQKHLQNAFDLFEKAFTTEHLTNDPSPPPSHSMAMVVSSALFINQKLRSVLSQQMELDGQNPDKGLKSLLKTSDEQVRSLTECLLALAPLAPKRATTKKMSGYVHYPSDPSLQMPTPSHSSRSISPIHRVSSAPVLGPELNHESQIGEHVDQSSSQRVSPIPTSEQSSPPNSFYNVPPRVTSRYSRVSGPPSPTLQPENYNDPQMLASRISDYRERKPRRSSGTAYNSYSGTNTASSSPSPPPMQHPLTHYDQPNSRAFYEREIPRELPRLQRYSLQGYNNVTPQPATSAYQRTAPRPSSFTRTDESAYPLNHPVRTSSHHRSSSGRSRILGEDYVNSTVTTTRPPSSRLYEFNRRYASDGQSPIDRRLSSGLETDRKYSRRPVNQYEQEDGYDVPNGYGDTISDKDYLVDDKGLRKNTSNNSGTFRQKLVTSPLPEAIEGNRGESNQRDNEINRNCKQDVQGSNVVIGQENDEYA